MSRRDSNHTPNGASNEFRLNKAAFSVTSLNDQDDDGIYWRTKTPQERLAAIEYLRRVAYGSTASARLQRVLTIARLGED
jgi:hypothetical protein